MPDNSTNHVGHSPTYTGAAMPYSDQILEHYNNPRNVGSFDAKGENVGTGLVGAP
jgi:NifU-like protein involved in Fe-S cluster formation